MGGGLNEDAPMSSPDKSKSGMDQSSSQQENSFKEANPQNAIRGMSRQAPILRQASSSKKAPQPAVVYQTQLGYQSAQPEMTTLQVN